MSSKENNSDVAVEKATEIKDKANSDGKAEVKGTKRAAEVSCTDSLVDNVLLFSMLTILSGCEVVSEVLIPSRCILHEIPFPK